MQKRASALARWTGTLLAAGLLFAPAAHAFRTASDLPRFDGVKRVRWSQASVMFDRGERGEPDSLPFAAESEALRSAAATWTSLDCAGPTVMNSGAFDVAIEPGDGSNVIAWVDAADMPGDLPADTPAVTDVQYASDDDGEHWYIAEADVYLNREIAWGGDDGADLTTVLTHELGHVLGLLHPCEPGGDDDGAPDCDDGDYSDSIMYPLYDAAGAMPSADDRAGYCALYGEAQEPCNPLECSSAEDETRRDAGAGRDRDAGVRRKRSQFGEACDTASDCSDGYCIDDGEHGPVCTRACGTDAGTCPADWRCASVDKELVCVSSQPASCQVGLPGQPHAASPCWLVVLGVVLSRSFRRRQRRRVVQAHE